MAKGQSEVLRQLGALFTTGSAAGIPDSQLLERFILRRDEFAEAAFASLVARHGPMVMKVCRSILRDPHDADDAFQATFMLLAVKAGRIGNRQLLGNWLYGVALRTAMKARSRAARRRRHERQRRGTHERAYHRKCARFRPAFRAAPSDQRSTREVPRGNRSLPPSGNDPRTSCPAARLPREHRGRSADARARAFERMADASRSPLLGRPARHCYRNALERVDSRCPRRGDNQSGDPVSGACDRSRRCGFHSNRSIDAGGPYVFVDEQAEVPG